MSYPNTATIKHELTALRGAVPNSPADFMAHYIWTARNGLNRESVFYTRPALRDLADWMLESVKPFAADSPYPLKNLRGYVGNTANGQLLTFVHADRIPVRLTSSFAEEACVDNPSTIVLPEAEHDFGLWTQLNQLAANEAHPREIPPAVEFSQQPEGALSHFVRGQHHTEAPLPPDTNKLLIAATLDRLDSLDTY